MASTGLLHWECGCGQAQLKLTTEPWNYSCCHCHSCVASTRFIDEKFKDTENHVTGLSAAGAFFLPNQVELLTPMESFPSLGCVKVGPNGKAVRLYLQCCGTQLGVVHKAFWALNANCLYADEQGTQPYAPKEPKHHMMKKFAFDPEQVPEPNHSTAPLGVILKFVGILVNPFGPTTGKDLLEKFSVDPSSAEEVPITWE